MSKFVRFHDFKKVIKTERSEFAAPPIFIQNFSLPVVPNLADYLSEFFPAKTKGSSWKKFLTLPCISIRQEKLDWQHNKVSMDYLLNAIFTLIHNPDTWRNIFTWEMMVQEAAISLDFYFDPFNKICFCILYSRL